MRNTLLASFLLFCFSAAPAVSLDMHVRDTAFCRDVVENRCVGVIPNGSSVKLSSLRSIGGEKVIYFWGNLRNPEEKAVGFYFLRGGECYDNEPIDFDDRALDKLGFAENTLAFINSVTMGEVWKVLGFGEGEIGADDIKLNVVFVPEANRYRIHDFRYVQCAGEFRARLIDSNGDPIAGDNDLKIVISD